MAIQANERDLDQVEERSVTVQSSTSYDTGICIRTSVRKRRKEWPNLAVNIYLASGAGRGPQAGQTFFSRAEGAKFFASRGLTLAGGAGEAASGRPSEKA